MSLAALLGQFLGAVLAECAPVLVEILSHAIRAGFSDSMEDGAVRDDLRQRLLDRLHASRAGSSGGTGAAAGDDSRRQSLGGGQNRPGN